ncbi:MAG TPA: enoyl-CoA hydratase-related protein [Gammaproteobacteria bacterium]|nr:enoyl-CoA hydratase-related protein [Gammaproteobacteria bacterium]
MALVSSKTQAIGSGAQYEHIDVSREDDFAIVAMCRERSRNSLSEEHLRELLDAFRVVAESDARGVVLAAKGPVFSSGHDFRDMHGRDLEEMRRLLTVCAELMLRLQQIPQPVIAQVEGLATAAGCQLVASCDLAVAAESAMFQVPGGRGGWFCHTPGVALARAVGRKRALEMLFTGDPIDARTALDWGLVNRVVAETDVAAETRSLLRSATRGSRSAKARGKEIFYRQVDLDIAAAYTLATEAMAVASQTKHGQERINSFVEKRPPDYTESD